VKKVQHTLTGYVDDNLIDNASKYSLPFTEREYDVGYRARQLPYYMGAGAQEKTNIAYTFEKNVKNKGLKLSITPKEEDRLYGEHWHHFVGNCRFMLGVEAGVSIVDLEGVVVNMVNDYLTKYPDASFDEVEDAVLSPYENNIYYRMISPRVFEAAAFKTGLILFEGKYNEILVPDTHYISLKKDFSNFSEVLKKMNDVDAVSEMIDNTYNDLILSGRYHYRDFINEFDLYVSHWIDNRVVSEFEKKHIEKILNRNLVYRKIYANLKRLKFPGRYFVKKSILAMKNNED